jgi:hypothetical protein
MVKVMVTVKVKVKVNIIHKIIDKDKIILDNICILHYNENKGNDIKSKGECVMTKKELKEKKEIYNYLYSKFINEGLSDEELKEYNLTVNEIFNEILEENKDVMIRLKGR